MHPHVRAHASDALRTVVGAAAILAPAAHSASDAIEWAQQGFSTGQLWLNYVAFLPMGWLLVGLCAVVTPRIGPAGVIGAVGYGAAFTFFAHTTLYALAERIPTYPLLWERLGAIYTVHGGLMVGGGILFAIGALRAGALPRAAVLLFGAGVVANLLLAVSGAPDMLQIAGSTVRNVGLMGMGVAVLRLRASDRRDNPGVRDDALPSNGGSGS